ncbi:MAG: retropepsin-like aspartic protease family protein [Boseongicola sp.]
MDSFPLDRLIYLVILGTAVAGWFFAENRQSLGKSARMALAWGLIFLGFIAVYGLWEDIQNEVRPQQAVLEDDKLIEIPRSRDGHFHLNVMLNGIDVDFLIDTGASDVVLTKRDAERIGLDMESLAFLGTARTANGEVRTAYATIEDVALGPVVFRNVGVAVNSGEMRGSLLGLSYLDRFSRIEIIGDHMRLTP